jgi:phage-related protein
LYIQLEGIIYVLHCFTKTTDQTEHRDIETAKLRLIAVKQAIEERKRREKHGKK